MDSMVRAGELMDKVEAVERLILRRYFFIDLEEFLSLWEYIDSLDKESHNLSVGMGTFAQDKKVRLDSQKCVRLYNRLAKFIK